MGIFPWEIRVAYHKKSQLQQSRATQSQLIPNLAYAILFVCVCVCV